MTLACFLRPFSRHGRSLSSPASGADRPLPGAVPSFRARVRALQSSGAKRMRAVTSGRSSRRSSGATSTAAIPARARPHDPLPAHEDCEARPASGVRTAVRSGSLCFPAAPGDSVPPATLSAKRNGASQVASRRLIPWQPGESQDEAGGRAGGQVHDEESGEYC